MTTPQHPHDLVGKARIRVFSGAIGHEDHVMAEGDVIAYADVPTLMLRHADGTRSSWNVTLRREVVGPFGDTPDVLPDPSTLAQVDVDNAWNRGYERGVAEGRRQATEAWTREWGTAFNNGGSTWISTEEAHARELAARYDSPTAYVVSRLVGPWEAAEQAEPTCTCPMIDVSSHGDLIAGTSSFVQGYDPKCPVCPNPYAAPDDVVRCPVCRAAATNVIRTVASTTYVPCDHRITAEQDGADRG